MRSFALRALASAAVVAVFLACGSKSGSDAVPGSSSSGGLADGAPADESSSSSSSSSTSSSSGGSSSGSDAVAPPPGPPIVTNETMSFGGNVRTYVLAKPSTYDASKSYPLVLSFHGNPGKATDMAKYLPFDSVSKDAAVIVYPQALDDDWDLYTPTDQNRDMNWIAALPDEIASKLNIDKTRIYGFGFSGGGFFLPQFTCRIGGIFKAISVNAGGGPDEPQVNVDHYDNGCVKCPGGPVAAIVTHGANDTEVDPSSGAFTHACYATLNGCSDSLSPSSPSPCQQHDGCPSGKPVKWCLIPGLPHAAWSQAMSAAWDFFTSLP